MKYARKNPAVTGWVNTYVRELLLERQAGADMPTIV